VDNPRQTPSTHRLRMVRNPSGICLLMAASGGFVSARNRGRIAVEPGNVDLVKAGSRIPSTPAPCSDS